MNQKAESAVVGPAMLVPEQSALSAGWPGQNVGTIRLEAPRGLSYLGLRELWRFRELLLFLTWRDIKVRYKQTAVGIAWAVLQPLMMMVVFSAFFGRVARLPTGDIPYPLFVYCGLIPWTFFASAVANAGNSVVGSEKLVTKVYFPRLIIPIAALGSSIIDMLAASSILVVMLLWYQIELSLSMLVVPICAISIAMLATGIGSFVAALNVAYRDFKLVLPFAMQLWMIATPSIFMDIRQPSPSNLSFDQNASRDWMLDLNPMVPLVDAFRNAILGHSIDWIRLGCVAGAAFICMLTGCLYFRWVEHKFADII